jgi:hypothetical protein
MTLTLKTTFQEALDEVDEEIKEIQCEQANEIESLKNKIKNCDWQTVVASAAKVREYDVKLKILYRVRLHLDIHTKIKIADNEG